MVTRYLAPTYPHSDSAHQHFFHFSFCFIFTETWGRYWVESVVTILKTNKLTQSRVTPWVVPRSSHLLTQLLPNLSSPSPPPKVRSAFLFSCWISQAAPQCPLSKGATQPFPVSPSTPYTVTTRPPAVPTTFPHFRDFPQAASSGKRSYLLADI